MNSMTGFGRGVSADPVTGESFRTEITSVNKKQLDVKISMPHGFAEQEMLLRRELSETFARGTLNVRIEYLPGAGSAAGKVDFSRAEAILAAAADFQEKHHLPGELTISSLLAIPDAVTVGETDLSDSRHSELLLESFRAAVTGLSAMRLQEGTTLSADILSRIDRMETMVKEIEPLAAELASRQTERLFRKLSELKLAENMDDERLLKEAVIYGDKLDVTEEITRLHCHFDHFRKLSGENTPGRSLDFLVQEIFRECNTLGNKAACPEISPRVVALKTELEKIREQIQNIE